MPAAMWFFRAVETSKGVWVCSRGRQQFDTHESVAKAVEHLVELASKDAPALIFAHYMDGRVSKMLEVGDAPPS